MEQSVKPEISELLSRICEKHGGDFLPSAELAPTSPTKIFVFLRRTSGPTTFSMPSKELIKELESLPYVDRVLLVAAEKS